MQEQFEAGVIIEAPVIDHNKGGLIVDCGIRGFVPISQIVDFPRRPQNDQPRDAAQEIAEKLQPFVGRKLRLKILEVNRKANRLILSEKVALYEERREKRDELFSSLQVGQKVTGTVRSIAPFGVFIDLGGIDGLVHKSELSWNKVNNPEAGYKVGEEVEAEVIDINHERGRISLSIRRLQPDPWHSTVADFKVGDVIDGTVTKLVNFGAFVRVRDGLEGLIHISELSHQRVAHPGDVVHEGQQLKLKIISLDSERHRLGPQPQAGRGAAGPARAGARCSAGARERAARRSAVRDRSAASRRRTPSRSRKAASTTPWPPPSPRSASSSPRPRCRRGVGAEVAAEARRRGGRGDQPRTPSPSRVADAEAPTRPSRRSGRRGRGRRRGGRRRGVEIAEAVAEDEADEADRRGRGRAIVDARRRDEATDEAALEDDRRREPSPRPPRPTRGRGGRRRGGRGEEAAEEAAAEADETEAVAETVVAEADEAEAEAAEAPSPIAEDAEEVAEQRPSPRSRPRSRCRWPPTAVEASTRRGPRERPSEAEPKRLTAALHARARRPAGPGGSLRFLTRSTDHPDARRRTR